MSDEPQTEMLEPGLYIVATPIGNLGDITFRAADVLRRCDVVACEDTRVTAKLLAHLNIRKPMQRYDDHASEHDRARMLELIGHKAVALVSDAGTPLISDPGYRLVCEARERGLSITSLPGACAAIMGLTLSGLPNDRFLFAGFLPVKDKARRDMLAELGGLRATLIFYETAPRLAKALDAIAEVLPGRTVAIARELTKKFEECVTGDPEELAARYRSQPARGEIVLLINHTSQEITSEMDVTELLTEQLKMKKPSQAVAEVARLTGQDRKLLYKKALELRDRDEEKS